jgi:hypothetical protein
MRTWTWSECINSPVVQSRPCFPSFHCRFCLYGIHDDWGGYCPRIASRATHSCIRRALPIRHRPGVIIKYIYAAYMLFSRTSRTTFAMLRGSCCESGRCMSRCLMARTRNISCLNRFSSFWIDLLCRNHTLRLLYLALLSSKPRADRRLYCSCYQRPNLPFGLGMLTTAAFL